MMLAKSFFVCFIAISFCCFKIVQSNVRFPEEELINSLLIGRNRYARPSYNIKQAINVSLELFLTSIVNIDEITGTLTTRVSLNLEWYDFSLTWDTSSNNVTSKIELGASDIWTPDLIVFNSMKSELNLDREKTSVTFCLSGIEACLSVLISRVGHGNANNDVSTPLRKFCFYLRLVPRPTSKATVSPSNTNEPDHSNVKTMSSSKKYPCASHKKEKQTSQIDRLSWDEVASGIDQFCCIIFSGINVVSFIALFILLFA